MTTRRGWLSFPITYCAREMKRLAAWIQAGQSGAVVGPAGVGKSNLLGFLCHRPDALALYLDTPPQPIALILVDLNDLPAADVSTLYRLILRAFYDSRDRFLPALAEMVTTLYQTSRTSLDPFTLQTTLRECLFAFQAQGVQMVLVLDRFDQFCQNATPTMTDTLRALRDSFKDTLSFLVGTRQEIGYLSDPAVLGELYEILDAQVCRVRPLLPPDAHHLITRELGPLPTPTDAERLIALTGGYPAWLKLACTWWRTSAETPAAAWLPTLLAQRTLQHRLGELWHSLSQEEQLVLSEIATGKKANRHESPIGLLADKGLVVRDGTGWGVFCDLLAEYIKTLAGRGRGNLWLDPTSATIYQGQTALENLSPLETSLLTFLLAHPHTRHTYTAVIQAAWPAATNRVGVSNEALFQVITGLRRKIEPDPTRPCYLVNWRGIPEGGYQCFPEGKPG